MAAFCGPDSAAAVSGTSDVPTTSPARLLVEPAAQDVGHRDLPRVVEAGAPTSEHDGADGSHEQQRATDGLGDDWPITYEDMKPYYDKVDSLIGIFGSKEGLPNDPDGVFLPPPKPRCYELLIKQAADRLKITCVASRLSILTQPLNGREIRATP